MTGTQKITGPLQILFTVFILVQPFLDTIYLYSDEVTAALGFSPSTILRFALAGILLIALLLARWVPVKPKIAVGIYLGLIVLYFILHHFAAGSFVLDNGKQLEYSVVSEFFYVCRLTLPVLLIFVTYYIEISLNAILKLFVWVSLIMSGIIIISNLFCVSLDSYTNETIKANIFSWFTDGYQTAGFNGLASKGFFYFANQTAAVFMVIFPVVFLVAVQEKSILAGAALVLQAVAMIMLGTKVSSFGVVMACVFCFVVYLFFVIIRKEKWNWIAPAASVMVILVSLVLIPRSPAVFRLDVHNNTVELQNSQTVSTDTSSSASSTGSDIKNENDENPDGDGAKPEDMTEPLTREEKLAYIEDNYQRLKINEKFILDAYYYEYDPDFWFDMLRQPAANRIDNRFVEIAMIQRAEELGGSPVHALLGISHDKMLSFFNIERDLVAQYYSMGIIGVVLFFGPFFLLLLVSLYLLFRKLQKNFSLTNVLLTASLGMILGIGYISGNTLDNMFVTILMGILCGCLCKSFWEKPQRQFGAIERRFKVESHLDRR